MGNVVNKADGILHHPAAINTAEIVCLDDRAVFIVNSLDAAVIYSLVVTSLSNALAGNSLEHKHLSA